MTIRLAITPIPLRNSHLLRSASHTMAYPPSRRRDRQKALADALAGVIGSLVALWVFYPMDVYKTRVASSSDDSSRIRQQRFFSMELWFSMTAGWKSKTLHTAASSFCYFYLHSWIVSIYRRKHRRSLSYTTRLRLSAVAAMLNTLLTLPLDVLSARQQIQQQEENELEIQNEESTYEKCNVNRLPVPTTPVPTTLVQRVKSLWKGWLPSLLLCTNPAIHYTVFDSIKYFVLDHRQTTTASISLSMPEAFVLGLGAKLVATLATYPLIRAKVLLMVTSQASIWDCLRTEFKAHGTRGLYQGCDLQLIHTMLKSALLMMVKERITRTTRRLLVRSDDRHKD